MPAQNYPAPGGPSLDEVEDVLRRLAGTGRVTGASFSTWNPALPGAERAAAAGGRLASLFLGDLLSPSSRAVPLDTAR